MPVTGLAEFSVVCCTIHKEKGKENDEISLAEFIVSSNAFELGMLYGGFKPPYSPSAVRNCPNRTFEKNLFFHTTSVHFSLSDIPSIFHRCRPHKVFTKLGLSIRSLFL